MEIVVILVLALAGGVGFSVRRRRQKRRELLTTPLTAAQKSIIAQQVPLTRKLPDEFQAKLEGRINLFLDQVDFIGCNGLDVTEEMRLSIAAQACLLVVNNECWYEGLTSILIYPNVFKSRQKQQSGFVLRERETIRSGESWARGPVILSWADSRSGAMNSADGHNVVFHEFAHQIDGLSGRTNGIPRLGNIEELKAWGVVFDNAYRAHIHDVEQGNRTFFDPYGASGTQEFFAVSVEAFFERPRAFQKEAAQVYQQLAAFFRLDPSSWA